ncbi:hypothetical protein EX30DRAFT_339118 [Ascodesmis nigricans]|uniref:Interferon-related developmental regulator N-terminal domain-containing protein n=1 Tax=Ascodesmis nigricans TaxID=341454 RepID=A0A4S2N1N7_9PEZI|nr:hypothetical protein EX30DRAFT_339118 [Ascodesmis nigricans]
MSGLRRRALDPNGKTVSRKAQSRASSAASSRVTSRAGSRVASRANTDDEASDDNFSVRSLGEELDPILAQLEEQQSHTKLAVDIRPIIDSIVDRKGSSAEGREQRFIQYSRFLSGCFAQSHIERQRDQIIDACLRSLKGGRTEKESLEALRSLALTIITMPDDSIYDKVTPTFKRVIVDNDNLLIKKNVIHVLGSAAFYGGATAEEVENIMGFFMEIIESDGHSAGAGDDAGVVTAALEEWGFLCTQLDDVEDLTGECIDGFVDQLDSSEVSVQVAAGENIALLYEKSYTLAEEDELEHHAQVKFLKRYEPYPRKGDLIDTIQGLTSGSKKYLNKRNKKTQRSAFADILHTVQDPLKGPGFKETLDHDGHIRGASRTVKVHVDGEASGLGVVNIDRWWKLLRLQHLRRILTTGFLIHWRENPVIFESLELHFDEVLSGL